MIPESFKEIKKNIWFKETISGELTVLTLTALFISKSELDIKIKQKIKTSEYTFV